MKKKKGRFTTVILLIVFIVGLCLLLYPTVADYWNSFHQSRAISSYAEQVANMSDEDYSAILESARDYNIDLASRPQNCVLSESQNEEYLAQLDVGGNGVMGYIEIPSIDVSLPVYHTTSDAVLQVACGHIEWTSLPVGGESSHCVLSGHRGLPSAKLFTHLDKLVEGDTFVLRILDEVLTYEVDQILIVLPSEIDELKIADGMDYCTLTTCTPYGINTHRMLVRGHRVENAETAASIRITADAIEVEPLIVATIIGVPFLILLLIIILIRPSGKRRRS